VTSIVIQVTSYIAYEAQNTTVVPTTVFHYIAKNRAKDKDNIYIIYRHADVYFCNLNRQSANISSGN